MENPIKILKYIKMDDLGVFPYFWKHPALVDGAICDWHLGMGFHLALSCLDGLHGLRQTGYQQHCFDIDKIGPASAMMAFSFRSMVSFLKSTIFFAQAFAFYEGNFVMGIFSKQ